MYVSFLVFLYYYKRRSGYHLHRISGDMGNAFGFLITALLLRFIDLCGYLGRAKIGRKGDTKSTEADIDQYKLG
jgi:hypothetical protein